jgi:hypothetical protein
MSILISLLSANRLNGVMAEIQATPSPHFTVARDVLPYFPRG